MRTDQVIPNSLTFQIPMVVLILQAFAGTLESACDISEYLGYARGAADIEDARRFGRHDSTEALASSPYATTRKGHARRQCLTTSWSI